MVVAAPVPVPMALPRGIVPSMSPPFLLDGTIDRASIDRPVDASVQAGVAVMLAALACKDAATQLRDASPMGNSAAAFSSAAATRLGRGGEWK